jgi:hypothetical protein
MVIQFAEFRADMLGVGVVEVDQDGQCKLPGVAGGVEVAGDVVGLAEVGEKGGLVVAVVLPGQVDGVLVAGDGLVVLAEVVVGVADAVPGNGLPVAVAEFLVQGEGLLAGGEGLPVIAELSVEPAAVVEGSGLPRPVTGGLEQVERQPGVVEGFSVPALPLPRPGEVVVAAGLPGQVTAWPYRSRAWLRWVWAASG